MKNAFQIEAFSLAKEFAARHQLSPDPLESGNGIQYDNYLNHTVFTIYQKRLDKANESGVEIAIGERAIKEEHGKDGEQINNWLHAFIKESAHKAKPKSPELWQRVGLRSETELVAFFESFQAFLEDKNGEAPGTRNTANESHQGHIDERVLRAIMTRRGQTPFRKKLLTAYECKCAITSCTEREVLEAAHIIPFSETQDYPTSNGILLRADIHVLFDLFLVSISPQTGKIAVSHRLSEEYQKYNGKLMNFPNNEQDYPSWENLKVHYEKMKHRS